MASTQFTALIRLPFPRGNFVDPPQAQWDAEKDRQLWKVISKSSKTSDLNWVELASKFQVPPTFLLQQAAWLYERHFEHVRNQMRRSAVPQSQHLVHLVAEAHSLPWVVSRCSELAVVALATHGRLLPCLAIARIVRVSACRMWLSLLQC